MFYLLTWVLVSQVYSLCKNSLSGTFKSVITALCMLNYNILYRKSIRRKEGKIFSNVI